MDRMDKKVILVVPPFSEEAAMSAEQEYRQDTRELRLYPSLGLAYLAAELLSRGIACEIIDSAALALNSEEAANLIFSKNPSVVGITVTSFTLQATNSLVRKLKEIKPTLPIVVGGPHITHWPDSVFDLGADYGIRGDGENSLSELVESLSKINPPFANIEGLVMKKDNGISINNGIAVIQNLDRLSFPARNLLPEERYIFVMSYVGKFATVISARGCIFDCIYCGIPHKKQLHVRSIDNIISELKSIANDSYGYVNFIDDCFTIDRNRTVELCNQISRNNIKIKWGCATRADYIDYELLKIMKTAGCYDIRFGVESGVEQIRCSSIGKRIPDKIFIKSFQDAKKAGLITAGFFLFGHPGETIQDMRKTVRFAKKLNPHYAAFMLATPVPGSRLFNISLKDGKLNTDIWRKISVNQVPVPVYTPGAVTLREMKALQAQASVSFYLRPKSIILKLNEIRHPKELFFKLKIGTVFLGRGLMKSLKFSGIILKIPLPIYKQRMDLPDSGSLEKLNIPVLDKHTKLIYHPITGILYQKRFWMVLSYLREKKGRILEVGCGRGLFLPELSKRCLQLYSIDVHNRLDVVEGTLRNEGIHNATLSAGSITGIPYRDRIFDAIVCISVLEHITDLTLCFKEFFRVLKDSGEVIIGFPVKNRLTDILLGFLNYNAAEVHPSSHRNIIEAAKKRFILQSFAVYPKYLPVDYSLYFVGKFIKRND